MSIVDEALRAQVKVSRNDRSEPHIHAEEYLTLISEMTLQQLFELKTREIAEFKRFKKNIAKSASSDKRRDAYKARIMLVSEVIASLIE